MEIKKIRNFISLLIILFFSYEIEGMFRSKGLSEPAQRVRDRALAISRERQAQRQAQQRENIIPQLHTFKPKPIYTLPRMYQDEIFSEEKLEHIKFQLEDNQFFVYQKGTANGIKVSKEIATLSKTLQNLIGDFGNSITKELIPIDYDFSTFSLKTMDFVFNILFKNILDESRRLNKSINEINVINPIDRSFQELIDINNFLNYLDPISDNIQKTYLSALREYIEKNSVKLCDNDELNQLHPDLQKKLVLEYDINFLHGLMIRNNMARTEILYDWHTAWGDESKILSTSFSPDGMQVAVGGSKNNADADTFAVFDLQAKKKVHKRAKQSIYSVDYNNTGNEVLTGTEGALGSNLISFDLKGNSNRFFGNIRDAVAKVLFSPDNTKVLALVKEFLGPTKLNIFDATTAQLLYTFGKGHMNTIAFSPDGKMILSASEKNLHLWTDTGELIKKFGSFNGNIGSIAFNSDGTKILVTHYIETSLWSDQFLSIYDISNPDTIPAPKTFSLKSRLDEFDSYKLLFLDDNAVLIWEQGGRIFFVSFDDNSITNEILIRSSNLFALKRLILSLLSLSRDKNKIAGGGKNLDSFTNYLHVWTIMKPEDKTILKDLPYADINQLRLIYQLWLASRQGIKPSDYAMDETERAIYQTLPNGIKQLLQ